VNASDAISVKTTGKRLTLPLHIKMDPVFAIARISFCVSNHSSSSLSAGMSVWDRKPSASKADGVGRQNLDSLDGPQLIKPLGQEIVQD
jgi:hypothetical protein